MERQKHGGISNHWRQTCVFSVKKTRIRDSPQEPAHVFYWSHLLPYISVSLSLLLLMLPVLPSASPYPSTSLSLSPAPSLPPPLPSHRHSHKTISNPTSPSITLPHIPYFFLCLCACWGSSLWDISLRSITCGAFSIWHLCRPWKLCKSYSSPPFISKGWITAEQWQSKLWINHGCKLSHMATYCWGITGMRKYSCENQQDPSNHKEGEQEDPRLPSRNMNELLRQAQNLLKSQQIRL